MDRYFIVACTVAICGASLHGADGAPAASPIVGSIHGGELYCLKPGRLAEPGTEFCDTCRVIREPIIRMGREIRAAERIEFPANLTGTSAGVPIRWRLSHDVLWVLGDGVATSADVFRIRLGDLDVFDQNDPKRDDKFDKRFTQRMRPEDVTYIFNWDLGIAMKRAWELQQELTAEEIRLGKKAEELNDSKVCDRIRREIAFVDFLPTSPVSGREFLLEKGRCQVWNVVAEYSRKGNTRKALAWWQTYSKDPVAIIDLGFTEPFTVFSHNGSYFFLTRSCKLYSATKDADGKWKVEKLWSEANRPIRAVITDTATNKSYAFTQAKADKRAMAKDVYFEFDAKLAPVEFDRTKIKPFQLDPPMNALREYTQVLIDAKKIAPTPPKKKE